MSGMDVARPGDATPAGEAIGGRWAVSWRAYIVSAPIIIALFMVSENGALADGDAALTWLSVQVMGYLAFGLVLLAADRTYLRNRRTRPVPVWVVVATGALAGAGRAVTIAALVDAAEIPTTNPVGIRVVMGAMIGAFWLTATAKFLATREELRREYRAIVAAQVEQLSQEGLTDSDREQIRHSLLSAVQAGLRPVVTEQTVTNDAAAPSEAELAAAVRAVSHRLWQVAPPVPRATLRQLAAHTVQAGVFRPRWSLAVFTLLGVVALGRTHGWVDGVLVSATYAVSVLVAAAVINSVARRWRRSPRAFLAFSAGVLLLVPLPFALLMIGLGFPTSSVVTDVVAAWLYTLGVMPLTSSSIAPTTRRRIAIQALRQDVDERQLRLWAYQSEQAEAAQRLARYLHGTVQADLTATALRRSMTSDETVTTAGEGPVVDDTAAASRTSHVGGQPGGHPGAPIDIERILAASSQALTGTAGSGLATPAHLVAAIELVTGRWQGIVDVDVAADPCALAGLADQGLADAVVQVVEELIQNASRHGGASAMTITMSLAAPVDGSDAVRIVAVDDGIASDTCAAPGIGSQIVSRLASEWSLAPRPDGSGMCAALSIPLVGRSANP